MFQVRIHGRGGQGVVTAAEMLSVAAFLTDQYAQAFPSFGSERMGAPVMAFCRISDREIRLRDPIATPDALIIQDPTLMHAPDTFAGLHADGYVLVNSSRPISELGIDEFVSALPAGHVHAVPATEIALKYVGRPIPNSALLGAFAHVTGVIGLEAVFSAIKSKFSGAVAEKNIAAAQVAFDSILEMPEIALAPAVAAANR
jgi:pyruvate ferredoxin oxidoreductase gamma subunit